MRISQETTPTPKPLTVDRLEALLQMQRTDPFCKCISKQLLNGKVPQHEFDTWDAGSSPSWHYTFHLHLIHSKRK